MIVVHHLNHSRSQRVLWLLEELAIPYEIRRYERDPSTLLAPPALKEVHPLGKSPVVTDGERTVAESGAMVDPNKLPHDVRETLVSLVKELVASDATTTDEERETVQHLEELLLG
jgi:hypothetical protein